MAAATQPKKLLLFDVDGTLTVARKRITPEMAAFMDKVRGVVTCGVVGGSDLAKQHCEILTRVPRSRQREFQ